MASSKLMKKDKEIDKAMSLSQMEADIRADKKELARKKKAKK